jgi:hypothetical protein
MRRWNHGQWIALPRQLEGEECDGGIMADGYVCSSSCIIVEPIVCPGSDQPVISLLYKSNGSDYLPVDLIKVLKTDYSSEGATMVKFQIKNTTFAQVINQFFVRFHEQVVGAAYNSNCFGANNIPANTVMAGGPFEAVYSSHSGTAVVDVWVVGDGVGTDKLPKCCYGDEIAAVQYTFHLLCECPAVTSGRTLLRGSN